MDQLQPALLSLLRTHGVRGLLDALADAIEKVANDGDTLPYDSACDIDPEDLQTVVTNLRRELF